MEKKYTAEEMCEFAEWVDINGWRRIKFKGKFYGMWYCKLNHAINSITTEQLLKIWEESKK